jgi:hypothetical protein
MLGRFSGSVRVENCLAGLSFVKPTFLSSAAILQQTHIRINPSEIRVQAFCPVSSGLWAILDGRRTAGFEVTLCSATAA